MAFFELFLDLIFPRKKEEYKVLSMTASEILEKAPAEESNIYFIHSALSYRNPLVSNLIWLIKYKRHPQAIEKGADLVFSMIANDVGENAFFDKDLPLLLPVPLFKKRKRERGFNQAELIADKILECGGKNFVQYEPTLLLKIKETRPQTSLNREERLKNVAGAFKIKEAGKIKGRTIFVIDDVTTTGATLSEIRKILLEAGAKDVRAYTIAR